VALALDQIGIDTDHYWRMFQDCRARTKQLWDALNGRTQLDRYATETALFGFRMWMESFVTMVRYGMSAHDALSRQQRQQYSPKYILSGDKDRLEAVSLIALRKFAAFPFETIEEVSFDFQYESFFRIDILYFAALHGQLGNFTHVTSGEPDEKMAQNLLARCYELYGQVAPLMKRHILEIRGDVGASEANIDGIHIIIGCDDEAQDWLIEKQGDKMSIRVQPERSR
jgi:hypothetical protein